jgi:hypothetical protein
MIKHEDPETEIDLSTPTEIYTIAHFMYGIAIRGEIPPQLEGRLSHLFQSIYGYDTFDANIAEELGAISVLTTV